MSIARNRIRLRLQSGTAGIVMPVTRGAFRIPARPGAIIIGSSTAIGACAMSACARSPLTDSTKATALARRSARPARSTAHGRAV
jgi:hypothetical protein